MNVERWMLDVHRLSPTILVRRAGIQPCRNFVPRSFTGSYQLPYKFWSCLAPFANRSFGALVAAAIPTAATVRPNQKCVYNPRSETTATVAPRSLALPTKYKDTPPAP